jgi:hypothetical protein
LKAAVWFRRGRLFMVSPVRGDYRRCQAEIPLIDLFKFAEPALQSGFTEVGTTILLYRSRVPFCKQIRFRSVGK